jgi:hypothetical protein
MSSLFFKFRILKHIRETQSTKFSLIYISSTSIYNTSRANETILVKFFSLNSSATAPKTQVPFGFPFWSMITDALSSQSNIIPSSPLNSLRVRTITARITLDLSRACGALRLYNNSNITNTSISHQWLLWLEYTSIFKLHCYLLYLKGSEVESYYFDLHLLFQCKRMKEILSFQKKPEVFLSSILFFGLSISNRRNWLRMGILLAFLDTLPSS